MVEGEEVSSDGLTWTFKLRPGLKFHDGEPVLAKDVVASLTRWMARDSMGLMIKALQKELTAVDDRTVKLVLSAPFPKMLFALGKNNTPMAFIMPERIAKTDPFQQITEYIGSGPMKFARSEWVPGAKAVFEKFADYQPRNEPASWLAGGKKMLVDRIEWVIMPDPATAAAALQNGEVDWWETPIPDLVPVLKKNKNIQVDIADPLGNIGSFRMNHMHPPFNNVKVRRAVQMALSQEDYMRAVVGDDTNLWKPIPGFFTPGTPALHGGGRRPAQGQARHRGRQEAAGRSGLCRPAGHLPRGAGPAAAQGHGRGDGRPAQEDRHDGRFRRHRLGHRRSAPRLQVAARDRAAGACSTPGMPAPTAPIRRATSPCAAPARRPGSAGPTAPEVEKEVAAWFSAKDLAEEKAVIGRLNKAAMEHVVYVPTGFYYGYQAWRSNVSGIVKGPLPFFWGVSKA